MAEPFARLLEELERERAGAPGSRCLSDSTVEGLAVGSLAHPEAETAASHLRDCLQCLHAYATLRSLLDPIDAAESSTVVAPAADAQAVWKEPRSRRGWVELARRSLTWRIPAGWAIATAAAAVVVTWMVTFSIDRSGILPRTGTIDHTAQSSRSLSDRSDRSLRTVTGTVERVQESTSSGVETYVVTMKQVDGATYIVFGWGRPPVRAGQSVQATGVFTNIGGSASAPVYKGVASDLRTSGGR